MKTDDGGPAFPSMDFERVGEVAVGKTTGGMSLRDWFAGQALVGRGSFYADNDVGHEFRDAYARQCYDIADALLKAREL